MSLKGFTKLAILIYSSLVGFWITFCFAAVALGFAFTNQCMWVCVLLAVLVESLFLAWIT
jgi:hypothetical protein